MIFIPGTGKRIVLKGGAWYKYPTVPGKREILPGFSGDRREEQMHELSVTESILNVVSKHAQKNDVCQVLGIAVRVGELSDLEDK